jgi:hypothetical protein
MTDVNYDFFVHVLIMIYSDRVTKHIDSKGLGLDDEFWGAVNGIEVDT